MEYAFQRTAILLGEEGMKKLTDARVAIFGIGGVGGYVVEGLVRSGIGSVDIVDKDTVDTTNLNRQIIATRSSIGRYKVDVMKERIQDINPDCKVRVYKCFYLPETKDEFDFTEYDYVVDAVDTVTAKLQLVEQANEAGVSIISCMGTGNKLDPTKFEIADIYETSVCPLAKVMRRELKKRGITKLKVVYSKEEVQKTHLSQLNEESGNLDSGENLRKKATPASVAFVPSVAGFVIASEVIGDLISEGNL